LRSIRNPTLLIAAADDLLVRIRPVAAALLKA